MPSYFDDAGFLQPAEKICLSWLEFERLFVAEFEPDETRRRLFENFELFLNAFRTEVTSDFSVWVDGRFVTRKARPSDIDVVLILNNRVIEKKAQIIDALFEDFRQTKNVDAYKIHDFEDSHRNRIYTESDKAMWHFWFMETRPNRFGKQSRKGFIELTF